MLDTVLLGICSLLLIIMIFMLNKNFNKTYMLLKGLKDYLRQIEKSSEDINKKLSLRDDKLLMIESKGEESKNNVNINEVKDIKPDREKEEKTTENKEESNERVLFVKDIKLDTGKRFLLLDNEGNPIENNKLENKNIPKEILDKLKKNSKSVKHDITMDSSSSSADYTGNNIITKDNNKEVPEDYITHHRDDNNDVKENDTNKKRKSRVYRRRKSKHRVVIKDK